MTMTILKTSFLQAVIMVFYIFLVTVIMQHGEVIFGKMNDYIGPVAFLLLFVLSAAITGGLVLGRSILWYLDGRKEESVQLFFYILGWLLVFTLITIGLSLVW